VKDCKAKISQNGGQNGGNHNKFQKYTSKGACCTYYRQPGYIESNCLKLKNKFNRNDCTSQNDGQGYKVFISKDILFTTITMKNNFSTVM
jgi:hypothetical protein